jgi:hypothetical protein
MSDMKDARRWDWTAEDYEHEAGLMETLHIQGWSAYCAVLDAECEAWLSRVRGHELH